MLLISLWLAFKTLLHSFVELSLYAFAPQSWMLSKLRTLSSNKWQCLVNCCLLMGKRWVCACIRTHMYCSRSQTVTLTLTLTCMGRDWKTFILRTCGCAGMPVGARLLIVFVCYSIGLSVVPALSTFRWHRQAHSDWWRFMDSRSVKKEVGLADALATGAFEAWPIANGDDQHSFRNGCNIGGSTRFHL